MSEGLIFFLLGLICTIPLNIMSNIFTPRFQNWREKLIFNNKNKKIDQLEKEYIRIKAFHEDISTLYLRIAQSILGAISYILFVVAVFLISQLELFRLLFINFFWDILLLMMAVTTVVIYKRCDQVVTDIIRLRNFDKYEANILLKISEIKAPP